MNALSKTIKFLSIFVIVILTSCNGQSKGNNKDIVLDQTVSKIEVIDFHSTHRCMTCNAIEANTK